MRSKPTAVDGRIPDASQRYTPASSVDNWQDQASKHASKQAIPNASVYDRAASKPISLSVSERGASKSNNPIPRLISVSGRT